MRALDPLVVQSGIFIVGMHQCCTDALSAYLNNHSKIACGPATHFYSQLSKTDITDALEDPQWPKKAANLIGSLAINRKTVLDAYNLTPSHIYQKLLTMAPTRVNMFLAIQHLYLTEVNKPIWIEKTPEHLTNISDILFDFPNAKIVVITKDPRELAKSLVGLPNEFFSVHANAAKLANLHARTQDSALDMPHVLTVKSEDLTDNTEDTLKRIFKHIEIDFDENLLSKTFVDAPNEFVKNNASNVQNRASNSVYHYHSRASNIEPISKNVAFTCQNYIESFDYPFCDVSQSVLYQDHTSPTQNNEIADAIKKLGLITTVESKFKGLDDLIVELIPSGCKVFLYNNEPVKDEFDVIESTPLLLYLEGKVATKSRLLLKALKAKFVYGHQVFYLSHQPYLGWWRYLLYLLFYRC